MTVADKIEPALSPEGWAASRVTREHLDVGLVDGMLWIEQYHEEPRVVGDLPPIIAFANAALPDSDLRKITREKIAAMRASATAEMGSAEGDPNDRIVYAFADALESYLPPPAGLDLAARLADERTGKDARVCHCEHTRARHRQANLIGACTVCACKQFRPAFGES